MLTLAGPAITTANLELVTVTELRVFNGTAGNTADATREQQIVDGVNRAAWERMRRRILKSTGTQYDLILDNPADTRTLVVPYRPIVSIASISYGDFDMTGWYPSYTYVTSDYVRDDQAGILYATQFTGWPANRGQNLRLQYQAGYVTVPSDIKHALLQWMALELERARSHRLDMTARTDEAGATTYTFSTIPATAAAVLDTYRLKGHVF